METSINTAKPKYRIYYNDPDKKRILEEHHAIHHKAIEQMRIARGTFSNRILDSEGPFEIPILPPPIPKPMAYSYWERSPFKRKIIWVIRLEKPKDVGVL